MENSAPQADPMDDGERRSAEALRTQDELKSLADRLALATTLGVGFWDWDVQTGAIAHVGDGPAFLGNSFDGTPMTTMGWAELVHPDDLVLAHRAYEPCIRGERDEWLSTLRLKRPDGSWQWMQVGGRVVARDANRMPLRVLGVVQDNKARKLAEDAVLRDAELLSKLSASVICTDIDGVVTYWNDGATRLYGYGADERLGKSLFGHYPDHQRAEAQAAFDAV